MGEKLPRMVQGALEALAIARGEQDPATYRVHVPDDIDVKALRAKTGLSQAAFAAHFGFTSAGLACLENEGIL